MNVGVFASGGDSPGMNAALRSVVRSSIQKGHKVFGVFGGYDGLIQDQTIEMDLRSVANIVHQGGTILKSSRSKEFLTLEGRNKAFENLNSKKIKTLIGLGGDGTIAGLEVFHKEHPSIQTIGVPCTIDNDYIYSEDSIGFDTATNTAVEAMDRVRDTASSHERTFIIEVMGRKSPLLAFDVGVAGGAEFVLDINNPDELKECLNVVSESIQKGKRASLIVVLESKDKSILSAAHFVKEKLEKELSIDSRAVVLGHVQRGGKPSSHDRVLASTMGFIAASALGKESGSVVKLEGRIVFLPFAKLKEVVVQSNQKDLIETLAL
jgi:6-phosphofructokinase 1